MEDRLVASKLHPPMLRQSMVDRLHLFERLERGRHAKLTLVSAPAGFGKTTLLAAVALGRQQARPAWLSLDASDNDPAAFWTHLLAALQVVAPDLGAACLEAIRGGEPAAPALLATLINELGGLSRDVQVILDDYHLIDRAEVHEGIGFVLEHLPPNIRLVIGTRADPPLALARLRARGELTEIRAADLRFTPEEADSYINGKLGLGLGAGEVATLAQRTEGWIAALQLAALSIEGRSDAREFIAGFAGNDRYVVDYLVEEVLQRQPEPVRRFLAATCFLERLSPQLCDAVTGQPGSAAMLEALNRANLFVVALDPRREWYRYHHLFADVLQVHFAEEIAMQAAVLHARASDWFAAHDGLAEAISHAFAAKDTNRAARLVEQAVPLLSKSRQEPTLRTWLEALPDDLVRHHPVLGIGLVGSLVSAGVLDGIAERLRDAERAMVSIEGAEVGRSAVDPAQFPALRSEIELYRAALAQVREDIPAVVEHAQRSIELAPPEHHFGRAGAHGFLAIAYWTRAELEDAELAWRACRDGLRRAGRVADVLGASIALADINLTLGRLRAAGEVWDEALQLVSEQRYMPRGIADVHVGLADLHLASGDLDLAGQHLARSQELAPGAGLPQFQHRWRLVLAKLRQAAGDHEAALDLLAEAERLYVADFYPNVRPIPAMRARVLVRHGRLAEAERWQREARVTPADELSYLREYEHVTLARLLTAQQQSEAALALLERLLEAAKTGHRQGSVIEVSILLALGYQQRGRDGSAALEEALRLAEPEGYFRVFLDEGKPMQMLLKTAARRGSGYARMLLGDFEGSAGPERERAPEGLIEPLSERERDVLRLLRSDLDGPDIARELGVSLNTLRTHTRSIYEKLGVNSRRAAISRAAEVDLP